MVRTCFDSQNCVRSEMPASFQNASQMLVFLTLGHHSTLSRHFSCCLLYLGTHEWETGIWIGLYLPLEYYYLHYS